jgi:hypothetical protein
MSLLLLCNHLHLTCLQIMNIFTKMLFFYFFLDRFFFEGSPLKGRQQNKHYALYPGRSVTGRLVTRRFVFWTFCILEFCK